MIRRISFHDCNPLAKLTEKRVHDEDQKKDPPKCVAKSPSGNLT